MWTPKQNDKMCEPEIFSTRSYVEFAASGNVEMMQHLSDVKFISLGTLSERNHMYLAAVEKNHLCVLQWYLRECVLNQEPFVAICDKKKPKEYFLEKHMLISIQNDKPDMVEFFFGIGFDFTLTMVKLAFQCNSRGVIRRFNFEDCCEEMHSYERANASTNAQHKELRGLDHRKYR